MTICPIAIAVHCVGCPLVKFCPAKGILGDYDKYPADQGKGKEKKDGKEQQSETTEN